LHGGEIVRRNFYDFNTVTGWLSIRPAGKWKWHLKWGWYPPGQSED